MRSAHVYGETRAQKNRACVSLREYKLIRYFKYYIILKTARALQSKVHGGKEVNSKT
jgi:hypothetical protein